MSRLKNYASKVGSSTRLECGIRLSFGFWRQQLDPACLHYGKRCHVGGVVQSPGSIAAKRCTGGYFSVFFGGSALGHSALQLVWDARHL